MMHVRLPKCNSLFKSHVDIQYHIQIYTYVELYKNISTHSLQNYKRLLQLRLPSIYDIYTEKLITNIILPRLNFHVYFCLKSM